MGLLSKIGTELIYLGFSIVITGVIWVVACLLFILFVFLINNPVWFWMVFPVTSIYIYVRKNAVLD
jgi:hypothetical protein